MPPHENHFENIEAAANGVDIGASLDAEGQRQKFGFDCNDGILGCRRWNVPDLDTDTSRQPCFEPIAEIDETGKRPVDAGLDFKKIVAHRVDPAQGRSYRSGSRRSENRLSEKVVLVTGSNSGIGPCGPQLLDAQNP